MHLLVQCTYFAMTSLYIWCCHLQIADIWSSHALACHWWKLERALVLEHCSEALQIWHLLLRSIYHLLPFGICSTGSLWSSPGMGLLCHSIGAIWDGCVVPHQKHCWSPWWLGRTASPLPLPAKTHQLLSAVVFCISTLPWSYVGIQLTSNGPPGVAWLIWLWCARTLCSRWMSVILVYSWLHCFGLPSWRWVLRERFWFYHGCGEYGGEVGSNIFC